MDINSVDPAVVDSPNATEEEALLTVDRLLDRVGVYDLLSTKELILRDEGLTGIEENCARSLVSLEILSLSHNRLTSFTHFQYLVNLIELNLNFNEISTLSNLQISDITPLRTFSKLNTISLYGNEIIHLDACLHVCRALPKLRALDLGGNPCSRETEGYKFQVVCTLPRLKTLDGDQVTQLDRELAEDYMVNGGKAASSNLYGTKDIRPFTAPAGAGGRHRPSLSNWDTLASSTKEFDPFSSKEMPRGNVRLFRDDFLNNHPILLEYLVEDIDSSTSNDVQSIVDQTKDKFTDNIGQSTGGFVEKMRNANPLPKDENSSNSNEAGRTSFEPDTGKTPIRTSLSSNLNVQTSHLGVDPSDPKTTIRKLLKHIEVLMETIASYKNRQMDVCNESLLAENKELRIENNNIPILQEQIEDLKKQLSSVTVSNRGTPAEKDRIKELENENACLKRENSRLRKQLGAQVTHSNGNTPFPNDDVDDEVDTFNPLLKQPKRLSSMELLDESASVDVELTELILQNEVSLEMIRNEIKSTKKEWEEQFRQAKEGEKARIRPSTSLGLSRESQIDKSAALTKMSSSFGKTTRSRQIHTSAGFQHGPEEVLLRQTAIHPFVQSNGQRREDKSDSSTTNILTL